MKSVLHVTPHLGGGVGAVVKDLIHFSSSRGIANSLALLDFPQSSFGELQGVSEASFGLGYAPSEALDSLMAKADITLLHYWNHPLLTRAIHSPSFDLSSCVVWTHVSGLYNPNPIPLSVLEQSAKTLFTSPISLEAKSVKEAIRRSDSKVGVVRSVRRLSFKGGVEGSHFATKTVAYLGTVSGAKMHQASAEIFSQLSRAGVRVLVGGGPKHDNLARRVATLGGKVEVHGAVTHVEKFLCEAQVFAYPLSPFHYGTGEQVLLEAMSQGLPVVAFNNPAEREIVEDGKTGYLVEDSETFVARVVELLHAPGVRNEMSAEAKRRAWERFSFVEHMDSMVEELKSIGPTKEAGSESRNSHSLLEILEMSSFSDRTSSVGRPVFGDDLINVLMERIKEDFNRGLGENWSDESKGTPFQYLRYFPNDDELQRVVSHLEGIRHSWLDD